MQLQSISTEEEPSVESYEAPGPSAASSLPLPMNVGNPSLSRERVRTLSKRARVRRGRVAEKCPRTVFVKGSVKRGQRGSMKRVGVRGSQQSGGVSQEPGLVSCSSRGVSRGRQQSSDVSREPELVACGSRGVSRGRSGRRVGVKKRVTLGLVRNQSSLEDSD